MKKLKTLKIVSVLLICLLLTLTACSAKDSYSWETVSEKNYKYITTVNKPEGVSVRTVTFDDLAPEGYTLEQSWDAMGIDDKDRVYIGWTSKRSDGKEDFAVFRYDNASGERKFLGTFMEASKEANNLYEDEQIPKGHTRMIFMDGKMYMGSQGFHDFKKEIDELPNYRGSHIYAYDIKKEKLDDISASLPDGVVTKNQGIVAMTSIPEKNLLVGLAHPHSDIVLFDIKKNAVQEIIPGIPWELGNPLSREIVAANSGKIYTYRGTEDPKDRYNQHNMWEYDMKTGEMKETSQKFIEGFWNGQAETKDGKEIYISTSNGGLYVLNTEDGAVTSLGQFLPKEQLNKGKLINYMYSITLSQDEKKIYAIPSADSGDMYEYDIAAGTVSKVTTLGEAIYTGNNVMDSHGNLYFAAFKPWSGDGRLLVINLSGKTEK
jgi:hypothetical protein